MDMFDLCIIGGGPAGYFAAERAAEGGLKTVLVEREHLGGVCLNEGCIPTKTLLHSAKLYDAAKKGAPYGVTVSNPRLDHGVVVARKDTVVKKLVGGVRAKLNKLGATVLTGQGVIERTLERGFEIAVGGDTLTASNLLIAVGSEPVLPGIPGLGEALERGFAITSREALSLQEVPRSMAIIGGGIIGLELGAYYHSAGAEVTIIEMLPTIAASFDQDLVRLLTKSYKAKGIRIETGCAVREITPAGLRCDRDGSPLDYPCDRVLVAIGRKPSIAGYGLENTAAQYSAKGIVTDEFCRSSTVPNLYAAGDVNGKSMLAHTAYREAEVAVNHILGRRTPMRYHAIPSVLYSSPELASVGETEQTAAEKKLDIQVKQIPMNYSGRYMAENEGGEGICKLIVEQGSQRLLGAAMIANYASEIIYGMALAVELQMRVSDLRELVFPHPTVGEAFKEALYL